MQDHSLTREIVQYLEQGDMVIVIGRIMEMQIEIYVKANSGNDRTG